MWNSKYSDGEFFEDKIVVVGPSATYKLHDVIDNPIGSEIKGPVMLLNVLAATMDHEFLRRLPIVLDLLIVSMFGLLAWLLLRYVGRWWICLLSFLGLSVAYLSLAFLFYNFLGIFVPIFPPLLTLLGCGFLGFVAHSYTSVRIAWFTVRSFSGVGLAMHPSISARLTAKKRDFTTP